MRRLIALCLTIFVTSAHAEGERAGEFDYYVLSLSWSPNWCAREGDARGADQCDARHDYGFTLHGLWPQYEQGWPSYCRAFYTDPPRRQTEDMADIMGSSGLAWHQWKKHGRCSGLSATAYFEASRAAYDAINRPQVLRQIPRRMEIPPKVIEDAFLEANPDLTADGVTVTCKGFELQEVRICLTRDLEPRKCGFDVIRDCGRGSIGVDPIR